MPAALLDHARAARTGDELSLDRGGAWRAGASVPLPASRPADGEPAPLPPHDANDVASRRRFMVSGLVLIATVWETLPILFFATCD